MLTILGDIVSGVAVAGAFVGSMYALRGTQDNARRDDWGVVVRRLCTSGCATLLLGVGPLARRTLALRPPPHSGEVSASWSSSSWSAVSVVSSLWQLTYDAALRRQLAATFMTPGGDVAFALVPTLFAGVLLEWLVHFAARAKRRFPARASNDSRKKSSDESEADKLVEIRSTRSTSTTSSATTTAAASVPAWLVLLLVRELGFAPLTEEIVFRGAVHHAYLSSPAWHPAAKVAVGACIFALAHSHHAVRYMFVQVGQYDALYSTVSGHPTNLYFSKLCVDWARLPSLMLPPLLFGLLGGTLVQLGVGLLPLAAAHAFCNLVGPPKWRPVVTRDAVVAAEFGSFACAVLDRVFPVVHVVCVALFVRGVMHYAAI